MSALDQCLQVIRPLQTTVGSEGIELADQAIDRYVELFNQPDGKLAALSELRKAVIPDGSDGGLERGFGDLVVNSVDLRIEALVRRFG